LDPSVIAWLDKARKEKEESIWKKAEFKDKKWQERLSRSNAKISAKYTRMKPNTVSSDITTGNPVAGNVAPAVPVVPANPMPAVSTGPPRRMGINDMLNTPPRRMEIDGMLNTLPTPPRRMGIDGMLNAAPASTDNSGTTNAAPGNATPAPANAATGNAATVDLFNIDDSDLYGEN